MIVYSRDADADRAFIRDALGFAHVDAGELSLHQPRHPVAYDPES